MQMPLRARIYVGTVTVVGALACISFAWRITDWPTALTLVAIMIACDSLSSTNARGIQFSLGLVVAVASFTLVGAAGSAVVCALSACAYSSERPGLVKRAFNFGQLALAGGAA